MGVGIVSTKTLIDIGNAIRVQNGGSAKYLPAELASAVDALDGTKVGESLTLEYPEVERGLVSSDVFNDIADAIRSKNGLSDRYKPDAMAAAILALTFVVENSPRAILFEDGLFWIGLINSAPTGHGSNKGVWEMALNGYADPKVRPWHASRKLVTSAVVDDSIKEVEVTSCSYWFESMVNLESVTGFENVSGATDFSYVFGSCSNLCSVFATSFDKSAIKLSTGAFYSCSRLVGQEGYVPDSNDGAFAFDFDSRGALCRGGVSDKRFWAWSVLYSDGTAEIRPDEPKDDSRKIIEKSRICAQARYSAIRCTAWGPHSSDVSSLKVYDLGTPDDIVWNMDYWFYGCKYMKTVEGLGNLKRIGEIKFAFYSCWLLDSLDMRGISPTYLKDMTYTFGDCSNLSKIEVDPGWTLPSGINWSSIAGTQTFSRCINLKGGKGTVYDSSKVSGAMAIVDTYDTPGYLTAKS